jgi:hypothetical protein
MSTVVDRKVEELRETLGEIEMGVLTEGYTLSAAIREGSSTTGQSVGWHNSDMSLICALSAGYLAAKARGIIND